MKYKVESTFNVIKRIHIRPFLAMKQLRLVVLSIEQFNNVVRMHKQPLLSKWIHTPSAVIRRAAPQFNGYFRSEQ